MLVAVAIIGLLVGLVGPAAMRQLGNSRVKAAEAQIAQLRSAIDIYTIDTGRLPDEDRGLDALITWDGDTPGWNGPYLRDGKMPVDPWASPYIYMLENGQVRVRSLGADRQPGGDGQAADITG